jgi:hypothetical protein
VCRIAHVQFALDGGNRAKFWGGKKKKKKKLKLLDLGTEIG